MEDGGKRKLGRAVLTGSLAVATAVSAVQEGVTSADLLKRSPSNVRSFLTKNYPKGLLKVVVKKNLPCVIVALGVVLLATYIWRIYILSWKNRKKLKNFSEEEELKSFFKEEDCHEALNENVKGIINFLKAYGKFLGIEGTIIEIPGSLVSEIFYESHYIFSEEKPIDKNLEEAKRQNKVEFKILCISREKESEAFFLKLKLKQNEVWSDKTYETRYVKRKRLIEFFNYVLEKASDTNIWEYKLKFEIKDGRACLVKIKKENSEVISRISIEEAKINLTDLESVIDFCYESNLKGIFEKTFIFNSMPEEFSTGGNLCKAIFLLLSKYAESLGIKPEGKDGITFEVRGAEAANFLINIDNDLKNDLKAMKTVKFKVSKICEGGYVNLSRLKSDGQRGFVYGTKYSTTNVGKIVDFVNFLLSKANKERKDGIEFKLEKVVKDQNTHVKLVKTENGVDEQEVFINKELVDKCEDLDDMFVEDLSCLNIEDDEFNLNLDVKENKDLSVPFELNDNGNKDAYSIEKLDMEELFLEGDENFGF